MLDGQIQVHDHSIEFARTFPDKITERNPLKIFLGCFHSLSYYYQDLAADRKILSNRLRKNAPKQWTEVHTKAVQRIKAKVQKLPILAVRLDEIRTGEFSTLFLEACIGFFGFEQSTRQWFFCLFFFPFLPALQK
jgi:hypothetical protein